MANIRPGYARRPISAWAVLQHLLERTGPLVIRCLDPSGHQRCNDRTWKGRTGRCPFYFPTPITLYTQIPHMNIHPPWPTFDQDFPPDHCRRITFRCINMQGPAPWGSGHLRCNDRTWKARTGRCPFYFPIPITLYHAIPHTNRHTHMERIRPGYPARSLSVHNIPLYQHARTGALGIRPSALQ